MRFYGIRRKGCYSITLNVKYFLAGAEGAKIKRRDKMSIRMKLVSLISAFILVLGLVIAGVLVASMLF